MADDLLHKLNALAGTVTEADRFAIRDGVLGGYVDTRWRQMPAMLEILRDAINDHRHAIATPQGAAPRFGFGIEIGTGSAKLYETLWPSGRPTLDVKLQLTRLSAMKDPLIEYPEQIDQLADVCQWQDPSSALGWPIEPADIDFAGQSRLADRIPQRAWNISYVYGTQGSREARRRGVRLPAYLRVLSAREEGLLMFAAIVPAEHTETPGTMAIEIGSGSTELILAGTNGRKHTIAFAIGAGAQTGLDTIVRALDNDFVARAERYLETDPASAQDFVAEALDLRSAGAMLFMNPSKASATFRRLSPHHPIPVAWARDYGSSNALDKYAPKAKILAALASAFGFATIHEGRPGGLKRAMADFIGAAAFGRK